MEELTIEEITEQVQGLKKTLSDANAKIDVWTQNLNTVKEEYLELTKKCKQDYNCTPAQLSSILEKEKKKVDDLLAQAVVEYEKLVEENAT